MPSLRQPFRAGCYERGAALYRSGMGDEDQRAYVPLWNGDPTAWKGYEDEVRVWLLAEKTDVTYSLAARLIQRLGGAARRTALAMTEQELEADPAVPEIYGEDYNILQDRVPGSPRAGVERLPQKLETALTSELAVRQGATMYEFFGTRSYHRKVGERMTEHSTRFDEGVNLLKDDGIHVNSLDTILGWFCLHMVRPPPKEKSG